MGKIPNFWISSFSKGHEKLALLLSKIVESPDTAPEWLSEGITHLSPKTKDTKIPKTVDLSLISPLQTNYSHLF